MKAERKLITLKFIQGPFGIEKVRTVREQNELMLLSCCGDYA